MLVIITRNYERLSIQAARIIARAIRQKPDLRLGLATGRSPRGIYRDLIRKHKEDGLDFSKVITFNLDEYLGLSAAHPQSFHHEIHNMFLDHVNIPASNIHVPDGSITKDYDEYCERYEKLIRKVGGIDLQLVGIGKTGHIGFNEPTSSLGSRTRIKTLTKQTLDDNQKAFGAGQSLPECAITMGIGTILEAKRILLIASGVTKSAAVAAAVEGPVTSSLTASALQLHKDVVAVFDRDAASELKHKDYYERVFETTRRLTPEKIGEK